MGTVFSGALRAEVSYLEEVIVTGTYLKYAETFDSSSPLRILDQAYLEKQGYTDISAIMADQVFVMGSNARPGLGGGTLDGRFLTPTIRGLGSGTTLTLINGKRVVSSGVDIAPLIAIKRVETLLDGASALYGSDAVAGVHNYITRDDVEGFELQIGSMTDTDTSDLDETTLSFIAGKSFDNGHVSISYERFSHDEITLHERNLPAAGDSIFGKTYRLREFFAPEALGVHPDFAAAYTGIAGFTQDLNCVDDPGSIPNQSGLLCGTQVASFFPVEAEINRDLVMLSVGWDLNDRVEFYGTYNYSQSERRSQASDLPWLNRQLVIPPNNPGLIEDAARRGVPLGTPLTALAFIGRKSLGVPGQRIINSDLDDIFGRSVTDHTSHRVVLGFKGDFSQSWSWDTSVVYSNYRSISSASDNVASRVELALNGLGGPECDADDPLNLASALSGLQNINGSNCYFFNPFLNAQYMTDGTVQTDSSLVNNDANILGWVTQRARNDLEVSNVTADLVATGDLGDMLTIGQRKIGLALGMQVRESKFQGDADEFSIADDWLFSPRIVPFNDRRTVVAAFFEFGLPLTETLDLQLAARYENYTREQFDSIDPKLALLWSPIDDLNVRASFSTAFRAPGIAQADESNRRVDFETLSDPANAGAATGVAVATRGNNDLDPYDAKVFNIGFSWYPSNGIFSGFALDLDYFTLDYEDLVINETAQGILNSDPFDPRISRTDSGIITGITTSFINAGKTTQAGFEIRASYTWPETPLGNVVMSFNGVRLTKMDMELFDSGCQCLEKIDGLGRRNHDNPFGAIQNLKANASIAWQKNRHSLLLTWRYLSSYENSGQGTPFVTELLENTRGYSCTDAAGNRDTTGIGCDIDSQLTLDVRYSYEPPPLFKQKLSGELILGAINITDEDPPAVAMDMGFDVTSHDARGRLLYIRYKLKI